MVYNVIKWHSCPRGTRHHPPQPTPKERVQDRANADFFDVYGVSCGSPSTSRGQRESGMTSIDAGPVLSPATRALTSKISRTSSSSTACSLVARLWWRLMRAELPRDHDDHCINPASKRLERHYSAKVCRTIEVVVPGTHFHITFTA